MKSTFLTSYRLAITPLSPIHIGCGEDYVPTNYVIDDTRGFLYAFNPGEAYLAESNLQALRPIATDYKKVTLFYSQHVDVFRPWARRIVPVGAKGLQFYRKMLAPKGQQKATEFVIERTAYEVGQSRTEPYVPGSSLKGTVVTALEERLNCGRRLDSRSDVQDVLGGDFEKSPMRFLRIGDCRGENVLTRVFTSRRFFKNDLKPDGFPLAFEGIMPAQFRILTGEMTLAAGQNRLRLSHVYDDPADIMHDLHRYSTARWQEEAVIYKALAPTWYDSVAKLFKAMAPRFGSGRAALVRLGKNAGAQSKTLHGENLPRIQIRHKNSRINPPEVLPETLTLCLTDEAESAWNGLPYGWAIIELDPGDESSALDDWCENIRPDFIRALIGGSVSDEWDRILMQKEERTQMREIKRQEDEARRLKQEMEAQEEARKAEALAAMSEEAREITTICDALESWNGNVNPGTTLFNEVKALLEKAQDWSNAEDKLALAQRIQPLMKRKNMYQGKAEKLFKAQLRALRGEA